MKSYIGKYLKFSILYNKYVTTIFLKDQRDPTSKYLHCLLPLNGAPFSQFIYTIISLALPLFAQMLFFTVSNPEHAI